MRFSSFFKSLVFGLSCVALSLCAVDPVPAQIYNPGAPIFAGTGLTQTGQTFSVNYGTSAGTALQGNITSLNLGLSGSLTTSTLSASGTLSGAGFNAIPMTAGQLTSTAGTLSANTSAQTIIQLPVATYQAAHLTVYIKQNNSYQIDNLVMVTDGTTVFFPTVSTANQAVSSAQLSTIAGTVSGGNITITSTYASGATSGKYRVIAQAINS